MRPSFEASRTTSRVSSVSGKITKGPSPSNVMLRVDAKLFRTRERRDSTIVLHTMPYDRFNHPLIIGDRARQPHRGRRARLEALTRMHALRRALENDSLPNHRRGLNKLRQRPTIEFLQTNCTQIATRGSEREDRKDRNYSTRETKRASSGEAPSRAASRQISTNCDVRS